MHKSCTLGEPIVDNALLSYAPPVCTIHVCAAVELWPDNTSLLSAPPTIPVSPIVKVLIVLFAAAGMDTIDAPLTNVDVPVTVKEPLFVIVTLPEKPAA